MASRTITSSIKGDRMTVYRTGRTAKVAVFLAAATSFP
jgi:hypothetical protein